MTKRFAVLGAGVIGRLRAQSVHDNPDTELVAVVDVNRKAVATLAADLDAVAYDDYRRAIEGHGLDAVIVSSPVHLHEEMCIAAFEAGCDVLCEKPLANSLEACRRIYSAAKRTGKTLAVGFNHRYYPAIKFMSEAIAAGKIGKLDHVRVFGGHDGLHNFRADWMYKGEITGGGAMLDVGIHMTDLARYIAGEVTQVYGMATNRVWHVNKSEDNATAVFRTESGIPVSYEATWTEWKGYRFYVEAYGDLGMVKGYYAPMLNMLITQNEPGGPRKRQIKPYPEIMVREKVKSWTSTALISFEEELRDFLRMLKGEKVPLADGWSGVRATEIANAVYESTRRGEAITLSKRD